MAKKSLQYNSFKFDISYEIVNPDKKQDFILLHGWGSNKNLMKQSFANHLPQYRHIYIDLPGFGNSSCDNVLTTVDYANILEIFLSSINSSKDIILGHSFGGKVALLLSPKKLVLVASAGIRVKKPLSVKFKIALFKIFKNLGLTSFRKFFVADDAKELDQNMYETFKNVVDEDFSELFKEYDKETLIFWAKDDTATPLSSAKKIHELIKNSTLKVYDGDHYFFMKNASDIAKNIEN